MYTNDKINYLLMRINIRIIMSIAMNLIEVIFSMRIFIYPSKLVVQV